MRQALQRLCRWVGRFRAGNAPCRGNVRPTLESLEERLALALLLDGPPAPAQAYFAGPPVAANALPLAAQRAASDYAPNPSQFISSVVVATPTGAGGPGGVSVITVVTAAAGQAGQGQDSGQTGTVQDTSPPPEQGQDSGQTDTVQVTSPPPGQGQQSGATGTVQVTSPPPGQGQQSGPTATVQVTTPPPGEGALGAGSSPLNQLQLPDAEPTNANGASNPPNNLAIPSAGAPPTAAPALIVPSVASMPLPQALDAQSAGFRISRTPADASRLQVTFVQTAYGSSGAVEQEGAACFVPESDHVDIPLAWAHEPPAKPREIVTLTLRAADNYRVVQPTSTLFLAEPLRGCSDAALFQAFHLGQSTEAFNTLFQIHRSAVFQTCYGLVGNMADAEDVSQFVFVMLARQPLRAGMNLAGWLHTVRPQCVHRAFARALPAPAAREEGSQTRTI